MSRETATAFPEKIWGGKVLLAGEYTVTCGGAAIAVYLDGMGGSWQARTSSEVDPAWQRFGQWVLAQHFPWFNQEKWRAEFAVLRLVSNLPPGIGLGSSGSLCAAIYARFAQNDYALVDDATLITRLAQLEGYFHGVSSGFDALVCLRQKAYWWQTQLRPLPARPWRARPWPTASTQLLEQPDLADQTSGGQANLGELTFFLWDCGLPRKTKNLMPYFNQLKQTNPKAVQELKNTQQILALALADLLQGQGEEKSLKAAWNQVAALEAQYLAPMIPAFVQELWPQESFHLKLCGAGGGGCFLGLAKKNADLSPLMSGGRLWQLLF